VLFRSGHVVFGSDRLFDRNPDDPLRASLLRKGITVVAQDGKGIDGSFDLAVFSTAVEHDNAEYLKVRNLSIPLKTRPEYLAEIVSDFDTVAVAGTSGKSTTAGMLSWLMMRLGMGPNFIGGGRVKQFRTASSPGNYLTGDSRMLVVEACESDGTIVNYRPSHSLIMNLDLDHHSISETGGMFETLARNTRGLVIAGGDDRNLCSCLPGGVRRFSIDTEADYKAEEVRYRDFETMFSVNGTRYRLSLPGKHNLYNALSCIAILSELGVSVKELSSVLPEFTGIERRFDVHLNDGGHLVIDDYAHNPHKIEGLMEAMARISPSVCYIFQPHGYGPTRMMKDGYIKVFADNMRKDDRLILLPIYYAGGTAARDISSRDVADGVSAAGGRAEVMTREEVLAMSPEQKACVVFGARDDTLAALAAAMSGRLKHD